MIALKIITTLWLGAAATMLATVDYREAKTRGVSLLILLGAIGLWPLVLPLNTHALIRGFREGWNKKPHD